MGPNGRFASARALRAVCLCLCLVASASAPAGVAGAADDPSAPASAVDRAGPDPAWATGGGVDRNGFDGNDSNEPDADTSDGSDPNALNGSDGSAPNGTAFTDTGWTVGRLPREGSIGPTADGRRSSLEREVPNYIYEINAWRAAVAVNESDVDVAVIDTGVDDDHPDLDDNLVWGVDTHDHETPRYGLEYAEDSASGHGTGATGLIAAERNGRGVVGIASQVDVYVFEVGDDGLVYGRATHEALRIAVPGPDGEVGTADDADVVMINYPGNRSALYGWDIIDEYSNHTVIVAAAGNDGDGNASTDEVSYPARDEGVIAAAATMTGLELPAGFSSEGPAIDVAAPGTFVWTTGLGGSYKSFSGTSAATPIIAGAAALLVGKYGELGTEEARRLLAGNATDIDPPGEDNFTGAGRIDVAAALGLTDPPDDGNRSGGVAVTGVAQPGTPVAGTTVEVPVRLRNYNDSDESYRFNVTVDGTFRGTIQGRVDEYETRTVPVRFRSPGEKTVRIGTETTTIRVEPSPTTFTVDAPAVVGRGEAVPVRVVVRTNGRGVSREFDVAHDGGIVATPRIDVPRTGEATETIAVSVDRLGNHTVAVRNATGTVRRRHLRVVPAVNLTDVSATVGGPDGRTLSVEATLNSTADEVRQPTVRVRVNDSAVDTHTVDGTLGAGDRRTVSGSVEVPANGTYEVTVDRPAVPGDNRTVTVTVDDGNEGGGDAPGNDTDGGGGDDGDDGNEDGDGADDGDGPPAPGAVPRLAVSTAAAVPVGGTVAVEVTLTNAGDRTAGVGAVGLRNHSPALAVVGVDADGTVLRGPDGEFDAGDRVAFGVGGAPPAPGESVTVTVRLAVGPNRTSGESVTVTVVGGFNGTGGPTATDTVSVPVVDPASPARFDADGDGRIGLDELLRAVSAYNTGREVLGRTVTLRALLAAVAAYNGDERVTPGTGRPG